MSQPGTLGEHDGAAGFRRGRPRSTSPRELKSIALRLFTAQGFENTTIEQIAADAGVSVRTFFRYFASKASVLFSDFEAEVEVIRAELTAAPGDVPMMDAIRGAVVSANHYRAEDIPEMRMRMNLFATVPALSASAAEHYEAWERAISEFAGQRLGQPADSLYPLAVGRATLATCRAAYDRWAARADDDLTVYLGAALRALADGFASVPGEGTHDQDLTAVGPRRADRRTGPAEAERTQFVTLKFAHSRG